MHALLDLFSDVFGEPGTYSDARPPPDYLERLLARREFIALIAESDGKVVGGLAAYVLDKLERPRSEIYNLRPRGGCGLSAARHRHRADPAHPGDGRDTRRITMAEIQQKIVPHLWFDKEARDAASFILILRGLPRLQHREHHHAMTRLRATAMSCMAISAGPLFRFNPAISFMVNFDPSRDADAKTQLNETWAKLSEGGKVLMPLDRYPFSERYGWIQDPFGLSWQLILTNPEGEERPPVIPSLLFVGEVYGKAEAAYDFYLSLFRNSRRGQIVRYPAGREPDREGAVMFTDFMLEGQWFATMDSAHEHGFAFNEAGSFVVNCADQNEIDTFSEQLSAVPEAEQCGWLKDRYGLSWQIVPGELSTMMKDPDPERVNRMTRAFLKCVADDVAPGEVTSFPRSVQARDGETVVFSWIRYESREQRERANATVMADPRLPSPRNMPESETPFDARRMLWGGFEVLVER